MRALVTNDDGVASPGLLALTRAALAEGLEVVVAGPARESSGASAALTATESDGRLLLESIELDGLDGVASDAVRAAPAFIVRAGVTGVFGPNPTSSSRA